MAFAPRMLRRLFCKQDDPDCPNLDEVEDPTNDMGTMNGSNDADFVEDDKIDFVEEDPSGQGGGLPPCSVDPDTGAFGSNGTGGDRDFVVTVVFQYQVQTVVNLTASDFAIRKIPLLERALSDLMVPDLFLGSDCENSGGGNRRVLAQTATGMSMPDAVAGSHHRQLVDLPLGASDLNGLDTKPSDVIAPGLDGVRCRTSLAPGAERCFVVNGAFTLHGFSDISWAGPVALEIVKMHMDQGDLNSVDAHVVDVRYLNNGAPVADDDASLYAPPPDGVRDATTTQPDARALAWPWVVLGCGVLLLAVSVALLRRRRRSDIDDAASQDSAEKALYNPDAVDDPYLQDTKVTVNPHALSSSPMLLPNSNASPRVFQSPSGDESEDDSDAGFLYRQRPRHFI